MQQRLGAIPELPKMAGEGSNSFSYAHVGSGIKVCRNKWDEGPRGDQRDVQRLPWLPGDGLLCGLAARKPSWLDSVLVFSCLKGIK